MELGLVILISYLIGNSNMATYIAHMKQVDLKNNGSGNPGASNAVMLMGWKAGILVALHDIAKAIIAVLVCKYLFPDVPYCGFIAGVSCVMGHMFPFWMKFKGGKGFASYVGMTIALDWKMAIIVCLAIVVVTVVTDYIVAATMTTIISVPIYYAVTDSMIAAAILCVATSVIIYKHRMNLVRIVKGTEIGLRSAGRGDHRMK